MRRTERLDALYAELPTIECKGLCTASCGPILMTPIELGRIHKRIGHHLPMITAEPTSPDDLTCPLLEGGRCTVYDIRPLACRVWGVAEEMECPFGCKPSRLLTREESFEFLHRAEQVGGTDRVGPGEKIFEVILDAERHGVPASQMLRDAAKPK